MWTIRIISRNPIFYAALPFLNDIPQESDTVKKADISEIKETGIDRLKRMVSFDQDERMSTELQSIIQVGCMSAFVGAVYGGFINSRTAYTDFINNNQATAFRDHFEAKKKLQDKITLSFGKGALRWSWRLAAFTTTYMTVSTAIAVYRGKHGIIEHTIAGGTAGLLYKLPVGPRAWVVGAALGSVLGVFAGSISYGIMWMTGISWDEVRYWQYQWKEARSGKFKEAIEKQRDKDEFYILHDMKVGKGKNIENVEVQSSNASNKS